MVGELDILNEWIPEQMQPGTIFVLENAGEVGEKEDPYWAVLSCPSCGMLGLITRRQINGLIPVICGSEHARRSSSFAKRSRSAQAVLASWQWLTLCRSVSSVVRFSFFRSRPRQLHRNLIHNLNPESFERGHTFRSVCQQADAPQVQVG